MPNIRIFSKKFINNTLEGFDSVKEDVAANIVGIAQSKVPEGKVSTYVPFLRNSIGIGDRKKGFITIIANTPYALRQEKEALFHAPDLGSFYDFGVKIRKGLDKEASNRLKPNAKRESIYSYGLKEAKKVEFGSVRELHFMENAMEEGMDREAIRKFNIAIKGAFK